MTAGLLAVSCLPAAAVVVASGTANTTAPTGPSANPYFANIGQLNGASAIYLGNGWVMTAAHVASSLPAAVDFGGMPYATQAGTWQQLLNPAGEGLTVYADIVLFRLASDPGLAALTVSAGAATVGDQVMMIGNGRTQVNSLTTWNVVPVPGSNNDIWTEGGIPTTHSGYKTTGVHQVSWGENIASVVDLAVNTGLYDTVSFVTTFSQPGLTQEGQGVNGDSGGGVFYYNGSSWELTGMIHAVGTLDNQPIVDGVAGSIAVYGDATYIADLSYYASQIGTIVAVPEASAVSLALLAAGLLGRRRRR